LDYKMKKIIILFFQIVLVLVIGFWLWCQRPGLAVERVFPSHPLVFARLNHVEEHVNKLVNSDFGKNIQAIDLSDVLIRNNFSRSDIKALEVWQKYTVKSWDNLLIKKILGKEASFVVYRKNKTYQFYFALRLTLSTRIAELWWQLTRQWGGISIVAQEKYQGRVINHILIDKLGLKLEYVRIRDLLIVTPDSLGHIQDVVDVYEKRHEPLYVDPTFNFVRQNSYPESEGLLFVNLNLFSHIWRGEVDSKLASIGYQTAAFPVYGISYLPGQISKYKMIWGLNEKFMPSRLRKTFSCPALTNDSMKFIPVDAIAYNWGGCYDFGQSWGLAKQRLQENPDLADGITKLKERIEDHYQVNIKNDVLPVLGHEIGGYLTDVDMQGSYPFPRLLVFVKIQDRKAAEQLLDKFTQYPAITMQSEEYNHVNIHYFNLTKGANMDPGYGFLNDYLLVATSRQLLKRSIDAYNDSLRSIVSDDTVEQFSLDTGKKFHSVTLMKTAELSRRAQDFLGWIDKYLSSRVNMAAAYQQDGHNKKQELDQAIADKNAELILAQNKLIDLKKSTLSTAYIADPTMVDGAIENLNREEQSIREDIIGYNQQKEDLSKLLDNYATGAQSAKLTMYNMENVLSPVLKGLESIDTQAVTVRYGDKILETEFLVK